jgi:3-deoxy-D-manno-octulosonic-acid transferase
MILALPFLLLRLWFKSRANKAYSQRISERFGRVPVSAGPTIWLHAVSVGETIASVPIVRALQQSQNAQVVITTTTATGSAQVKRLFGDSVKHYYFPFDVSFFMSRFMRRLKVRALLIMETEIWPNLLYVAKKKIVPVYLLNARMAPQSAMRYARYPKLTAWMLNHFTGVLARYKQDAERFIKLGLESAQCQVVGDMKFDMSLDDAQIFKGKKWREAISNRFVWIAASTHRGEDDMLLTTHQQLLNSVPNALLILVPRHPERFQQVLALVKSRNLICVCRSETTCWQDAEVVLGDTMGELMAYYAAADSVFMGGTWVPVGGHNFIEPARLGKVLFSGPYYHHFQQLVDLLVANQALQVVANENQLAQQLCLAANDQSVIDQKGAAALNAVTERAGATLKTLSIVLKALK